VEGPRDQSTCRISSSDAVGFSGFFIEQHLTTKSFVVSTKIFVDEVRDAIKEIRSGFSHGKIETALWAHARSAD
jgi:hypothetical protein